MIGGIAFGLVSLCEFCSHDDEEDDYYEPPKCCGYEFTTVHFQTTILLFDFAVLITCLVIGILGQQGLLSLTPAASYSLIGVGCFIAIVDIILGSWFFSHICDPDPRDIPPSQTYLDNVTAKNRFPDEWAALQKINGD